MFLARFVFSIWCVLAVAIPAAPSTAQEVQDKAYIQVSSHSTLKQAIRAANRYVEAFPDLEVYSTSTGYFAVTVASIVPQKAARVLEKLKSNALIPQNSVYTPGYGYLRREWQRPTSAQPTAASTLAAIGAEQSWTESARRGVQNALVWSGDYVTRIDGDIGPSTRRAIKSFQATNGFAPTGYLTADEIGALEAIRIRRVAETGFQDSIDDQAGIRIGIPLRFFSNFSAEISETGLFKTYTTNREATSGFVTLISHELLPGQLQILYEVIDGLDTIPSDAYRVLRKDWFVISGSSAGLSTYAYVRQFGNDAKGFLLTWPENEAEIYGPISMAMYNSMENIPGINLERYVTLHPSEPRASAVPPKVAEPAAGEAVPPVASKGSTGTGFFVNSQGYVVTNEHVIAGCSRLLTVDGQPASVVVSDEARDLAVLFSPASQGLRLGASFAGRPVDLNADVTVVGYPLQGILQGLNVTRGSVSGLFGILGDTTGVQITAPVQQGNSGGPLLDEHGNVVGVVQSKLNAIAAAKVTGDIPQNVNFAIRGETVLTFLSQNSISYDVSNSTQVLPPTELAARARSFTAFVECH